MKSSASHGIPPAAFEQNSEDIARALAIDGKTLRGRADAQGKPLHLFAALWHTEEP